MKGMSFTARIFLVLLVTAVVTGILTKAFTNIAEREDPNFVDNAFKLINQKYFAQKDYSETQEEDISNVKALSINGVGADIVVEVYEGSTLKMEYAGKVSERDKSETLISVQRGRDDLNLDFLPPRGGSRTNMALQWNGQMKTFSIEGESHLEAKILLPKSYRGDLRLRTTSGDIILGPALIMNLTVATLSGDIELDHSNADRVTVTAVSGDITVDGAVARSWNIKNTSGGVTMYLPRPETMHIDLQSISGDISQSEAGETSRNAKGELRVKTVSGDIVVKRYTEEHEDRD